MTTATGKSTTRSSGGRPRQQRSGQQRSGKTSQPARTTSTAKATDTTKSTSTAGGGGGRARSHGTRVDLPFVSAEFHRPDVHLPSTQDVTAAAQVVRSQMPSPTHALFYGGLAAGAILSVIEWPVALAIGVGTALVSREPASTNRGA
jgi:hypothetical protein